MADEEAIRKIKQLDESVHQLQRQVAVQKQVCWEDGIKTVNKHESCVG